MTHKIINKFLVFVLFSLGLSTSLLTSCGPDRQLELSKVDSLQQLLIEAEESMNIDKDLLKSRSREINNQRDSVLKFFKDTFPYELGANLDRYKSIMKSYKRSTDDLEIFKKEHKALSKQISDLKDYVKSKDYHKDSFKLYLRTERQDVIQLHQNCTRLESSLYEIEPEYQRVRTYLEGVLDKIRPADD